MKEYVQYNFLKVRKSRPTKGSRRTTVIENETLQRAVHQNGHETAAVEKRCTQHRNAVCLINRSTRRVEGSSRIATYRRQVNKCNPT